MKNVKDYIQTIFSHKLLILGVTVLVAILALVVSFVIQERFIAESTLIINRVNREETAEFQYDNYYSVQASEFVSNTVVGLMASPDVIKGVYDNVGVYKDQDAYALLKNIKSQQKSSHLVSVRVYDVSKDAASLVLDGLIQELSKRVSDIEITSAGDNAFAITSENKVFSSTKKDPYLVLLIGSISGIFVGVSIVFLKEYLFSGQE